MHIAFALTYDLNKIKIKNKYKSPIALFWQHRPELPACPLGPFSNVTKSLRIDSFDGWGRKCFKPLAPKSVDTQSGKNDHAHLRNGQIFSLTSFLAARGNVALHFRFR